MRAENEEQKQQKYLLSKAQLHVTVNASMGIMLAKKTIIKYV